MMINFMKHRNILLGVALILTTAAFVFWGVWGLNYNIDFTGGSLLEIKFKDARPPLEEVRGVIDNMKLGGDTSVQITGEQNFIIRFQQANEETHQKIVSELNNKYTDRFQEQRFESIGPAVGKELKTKALYSISLSVIAMIIYIAFTFKKVSYPVASWKYGVFASLALLHDVMIVVGLFAILGHFAGVEVGLTFVAALLTVLGYSINDTIVVYDRVRENLGRLTKISFIDLVNRSLNETLTRSINTGFATLLSLLAIFFFGGASIKFFALALIVGILAGTYSSIFIACPLLILANRKK